ncbi:hypothetical protein UlMin_020866 [Ulmus minor]
MASVRDDHEHPMFEIYAFESLMCNLCGNNIDQGSWYCRCRPCKLDIHLSCGKLPLSSYLSSHPQHPLKLVRYFDDVTCYYCEKKSYKKSFMYTCHQCSFYIHFSCSKIPMPTMLCDGQNHVQYICHNHPMTLVERDCTCDGVVRHCFACQSPLSSGPSYICKTYCPNVFHKACAELPEKIEHSLLHPYHPLKLQVREPQSCDACHKRGGKLMYFCCEQGCNFRLGTECAFLIPTVKWDRHDDSLFLMENAYCGTDQYCDACHNSYEKQLVQIPDEVIRTQSFLFRCMECNFNFHFLCGPLPITIEHECHMHMLTLVDSISEDDSTESYCDVCEGKRDQRFRVYYCADCKYVTHIHCVVSEVTKILKGDHKNVKLLALGDARWKSNDTDMVVEGMSGLTMRHIMERLTERERNQLMYPFRRKEFFKHRYEIHTEKNSHLEHKGDGEDIHRIQSLFNFDETNFKMSYLREFWCFDPDTDVLKLDEIYLKMKVVDVKGYQVPNYLAPVLKTLLSNYGDFGCDSTLTPQMRSFICTLLCIVVDSMSTTKVEDITKDLLHHWFFYWRRISKISRKAGFNIDFLYDHLRKLMRAFLGFEGRRFKNQMEERLRERITDIPQQMAKLQAELESSELNLEKVKSYGESATSDFMKENLQLSSKFKWKDACEGLV